MVMEVNIVNRSMVSSSAIQLLVQRAVHIHADGARDMPAALDIAMPQEVVRASALTGRLDFLVHLPHSTRYLFKVLFAEH